MRTDALVIGCGIAGAVTALELARDAERRVTVITRADRADDSNSAMAQGGIIGRGLHDSAELLTRDILRGGDGLSYRPAVEVLAGEGPRILDEMLVRCAGVEFDRDREGKPSFGLEGAHSRRRILHVGDGTGKAIMDALLGRLARSPNIRLVTGATAVDLLTFPHRSIDPSAAHRPARCLGAYVLRGGSGRPEPVPAAHTVLATGGLGQLFLNTSNPQGARGDGLAMALRAGVQLTNLEYVQFHPTTLYMPGKTKLLITEAARGEGGVLLTPLGEPFMERHSPRWGDLAPRYVVARAIYEEMLANGYPFVLLDLTSHRSGDFIRRRFPNIHSHCLAHGIDMTRQPIPVVPAAHYSCGGVTTDLRGRTSLCGLWAVGEVACTGVHGANRIAGSSLLEGVVWGSRAACDIRARKDRPLPSADDVPAWDDSGPAGDADPAVIQEDLQTIRNLMWHSVGLVRTGPRLARAIHELRHLSVTVGDTYRRTRLTDGLVGLRNSVQTALTVARAAHRNVGSRGCHCREDGRAELEGSAHAPS